LVTVALAAIGFGSIWKRDARLAFLIAATVAYFVIISAGSEAEKRFRVPVNLKSFVHAVTLRLVSASHERTMDLRKHFLEAATLIGAAILCAVISNAIASRERKMALVGLYPNAFKVPAEPAPLATTTAPATTTANATVEVSPSHAAPMTIAPATTGAAATTTTTTAATTTGAASKTAATKANAPAPPAAPTSSADVLKRFQPHPDKAFVEIGYDEAAALHRAGALFLDARRTSIYEQGHIAGARPYSVWESDIDDKVRKLFDERGDPQQQALPIVNYCSGGECEDSHMLAQKLWGIQFNNVYVYKDGFPDWQKRGGAVHVGSTP
jgi:rhodanese-related sulfurtransferase